MTTPLRVLYLEDNPADVELCLHALKKAGYAVEATHAADKTAFAERLADTYDVILADYALPQFNAQQALHMVQERGLDVPFLVVSGTIGEDVAVEMVKLGAADYLLKDRLGRLGTAVTQALEARRLRQGKGAAEEALRAQDRLLRAVVENASDGIALLRQDMTIAYLSPAAKRLGSYGTSELSGASALDFIHPDDRPAAMEVVVLAMEQPGQVHHVDIRARQKDGSWRWIECTANNLLDEPSVERIVVNYRDIEDRKRAEAALRESEEKFRTLAEESPNIIFINRSGRVLYANKKAEEVMGYNRQELYAPDFDFVRLIAPESRPAALEAFRRHQAGEDVPPKLYTLVTKGGRRLEGLHNTHLIEYDGRPAILGIITDVSEARRAEDALRKSEAMLKDSQRVAAVGHYDLDVVTGLWTSSEMLDQIFGIDGDYPRTVEGWLSIVHADHRAEMYAYLRDSVLKEKNAFDKEYPIVRVSDDSVRWVHGRGRLQFDAEGQPVRMFGVIRDITEQKQSEQALRASEERYRSFLQNFEGIAYQVEARTWQPQFFHGKVEEITGYPAQAFVAGQVRWDGLIHPDDLARIAGEAGRLASGQTESADMTYRIRRADGSERWVRDIALRLPPRDGGGALLQGTISDVTDQLRAENALRESEERYRALTENSAIGIYRTTPDGEILFANPAAVRMLGFDSFAELAQRNLENEGFESTYPRAAFKERLEREGKITGLETAWRRRDGTTIFVRENARVMRDDHGASFYEGTVEDISERKQAEQAVRQLSEFNEGIIRNMTEGIVLEEKDGTFSFVNPAAASMLGYRADELIGKPFSFILPEDQMAAVQAANERRAQGKSDRYELQLQRKDGSRITVLVSGSPRHEDGQYAGTIAVFTDISDLKRAQADLDRRAGQLQSLHQTALEINAQPNLQTVLQAIVERAASLLGSESGGLYLLRPDGDTLEMAVVHGMLTEYLGTTLHRGEGLSGQALEAGRAMFVEDYTKWPGRSATYERAHFRRVLAVPLTVGRRIVGVLNAADMAKPGSFTPDEIRLAEMFADQAALAVENARLLEAERERTGELEHARALVESLSRMAAQIESVHDPAGAMVVLGNELRAMGLNGVVALKEKDTGDLLVTQALFDPGILGGVGRLVGQSVHGARIRRARMDFYDEMFLQRKALVVSSGDLMRAVAPDLPDLVVAGLLRLFNIGRNMTTLCLPLAVEDRAQGALFIGGQGLQESDLAAFSVFAGQLAGVLEKTRLLEETRRRADYLEGVTSVSMALRAAGDRDEMMSIICNELTRLLKAPHVAIVLRASPDEVVVQVGRGSAENLIGLRAPANEGISGYVLGTGRPFLTAQATQDERIAQHNFFRGAECVIGVPLAVQERGPGLVVAARDSPFEDEDVRLLTAIAEMAGNALNRAGVMETLEQRVTERTADLEAANLRLQELDQLKSAFVSNVSHELRSPITNILLYLDLLAEPKREDRRPTYMGILHGEANRLHRLIEDLLTLSRLERGTVPLDLEPQVLDALIAEVTASQLARAHLKQIDLRHEPNPKMPLASVAHGPMVQVLTNLIGNAVNYSPAGAVVTVSTRMDEARGSYYAAIQVHNSQPAIPEEDLPHLFERFFRGQTALASGEAGTGLGLAICKEIVDLHHGWIDVESAPDMGTAFTVWLPLSG